MTTTQPAAFAALTKSSHTFIFITQGLMMAFAATASYWQWGTRSAFIITVGSYLVYQAYALITRNEILIKLLLFGLIAGFLELLADHYSVSTIGKLIYPSGEAMLWTSPAYMPLSWAITVTQLGYMGLLLIRSKGLLVATVVLALSGGLYIPFFEHMAKAAGWWYYVDTSMLYNAPYYIIICEALVGATLPFAALWTVQRKLPLAVLSGLVVGLWIWAAAVIAYAIAP